MLTHELLRQERNYRGKTLTELARKLGYPNGNFISMVETGKSLIPLDRIVDFCRAYQIEDSRGFGWKVLAERHPDLYQLLHGNLDRNYTNRSKKLNSDLACNPAKSLEDFIRKELSSLKDDLLDKLAAPSATSSDKVADNIGMMLLKRNKQRKE